MLSHDEARRRVAQGAAYLDHERPGWFNRIDVGRLQLSSCSHCVAAQLGGDGSWSPYSAGLRALGLSDSSSEHGMALRVGDYPTEPSAEDFDTAFALLQDAWIGAIADRKCALAVARHDDESANAFYAISTSRT